MEAYTQDPQFGPRLRPSNMPFVPHDPPPTPVIELKPNFSQQLRPEKSFEFVEQGFDHFRSVFVSGLAAYNFHHFISTKEKALIYFYNTNKRTDFSLEPQFVQAAEKIANLFYGFGTVDCLYDQRICEQYNITNTPTLKLFSNGFEVSTIRAPESFTPNQIHMLMKMTPALTKPRVELGKEYLARQEVFKKPVKKRQLPCL